MVMDIRLGQVLLQPRTRLTMVTVPRVGMMLPEVAAEEEGMVMVEMVEVGMVAGMEVEMEVVINTSCDPLSTRMQSF